MTSYKARNKAAEAAVGLIGLVVLVFIIIKGLFMMGFLNL